MSRMIMSRTPLRITFVGGGTDIPAYFRNYDSGAVISASMNKYIHIAVNKKFDNSFRISYSSTEIVDKVDEIKHPSVREALKLLGINGGIEIVSISDVPSRGTGLGSSSTFLVGLLNALHAYLGDYASPKQLAEEAVKIEREILSEPGGLQDQYMAAYGGIQVMRFYSSGMVSTDPVIMSGDFLSELEQSMILLYTGIERNSTTIHASQQQNVKEKLKEYDSMKGLVSKLLEALGANSVEGVGRTMHENWMLKRSLADGISDQHIDSIYDKAIELGAYGGKLIGAGGGGFLLFIANQKVQENIISTFPNLRRENFRFDFRGSRIVFVGD